MCGMQLPGIGVVLNQVLSGWNTTYPRWHIPSVQPKEPCDALTSITKNEVGLVNPEKVLNFYNELHSYLSLAGIDGVNLIIFLLL